MSLFSGAGAQLAGCFTDSGPTSQPIYFTNQKVERVIDSQTEELTSIIVHYPSGAYDVYGFAATNSLGNVLRYMLTSKVDPQGRQTTIEYAPYDPLVGDTIMSGVPDADQNALTFEYLTDEGYTNFVSRIVDSANRDVELDYDLLNKTLTTITDAPRDPEFNGI